MEPKVEARPPLEKIKSKNQEIIKNLIQKMVVSLTALKRGDSFHISSDGLDDTIFNTAGDPVRVVSRIKGEVYFNSLKQTHYIELVIRDTADSLVAQRLYFCKVIGNKMNMLHIESSLNVSHNFDRIGIGTALIMSDDAIRLAIANQFKKFAPISKIEAEITDGTYGKNEGWTTRRFEKRRGWKQIEEGIFRKTTNLSGHVGLAGIFDTMHSKVSSRLKKRT